MFPCPTPFPFWTSTLWNLSRTVPYCYCWWPCKNIPGKNVDIEKLVGYTSIILMTRVKCLLLSIRYSRSERNTSKILILFFLNLGVWGKSLESGIVRTNWVFPSNVDKTLPVPYGSIFSFSSITTLKSWHCHFTQRGNPEPHHYSKILKKRGRSVPDRGVTSNRKENLCVGSKMSVCRWTFVV